MTEVLRRYGPVLTGVILLAVAVWLALLVVLPQLMMIGFSFRPSLPPSKIGGPEDVFTVRNYLTLWTNQIHLAIFLKTIWASALVTATTLAVCYPVAFYLAQVAPKRRLPLLILMLIVPFWINELLRTFSWYIILAFNGPLNALLLWLGIIDEPQRFLGGDGGVIVGMVYVYILFMVFPLYNAIESLDRNQIEAARDLGAGWLRIHRRIVLPHAKPGIAVGCIMTFMLAAGSYAVPALLGGPNSRWFTEIIYNWFFEGGNWNQGAAYAFILLVLCIGFILGAMRLFRVGLADIAK
ncbi:spermidine/putrescine transport system permease protein [Azospirillum lipoferum]|uniref:ABC transporter permease n=1 Tax=Azospirillum lipoferum TaxID=193 RepID=A0A5A9GU64_AZOLI|nr:MULTISPECIES: ABC transporter permease [Azospirillum]KAA0597873.1 ABC transporter permease [Azospirillum lipoferum]MCP1609986.1 spermidine/putrescine transport system permease protein [Azospirillum lipoferum]MDW5534521.1 ABC transporter permease [Azospirillum sp. NL1]